MRETIKKIILAVVLLCVVFFAGFIVGGSKHTELSGHYRTELAKSRKLALEYYSRYRESQDRIDKLQSIIDSAVGTFDNSIGTIQQAAREIRKALDLVRQIRETIE